MPKTKLTGEEMFLAILGSVLALLFVAFVLVSSNLIRRLP